MRLDETHDPARKSWIESANEPGCEFPIQNLPFGIFRRKRSKEAPRGGVAIGDRILDLAAVGVKTGSTLNRLAAAGGTARKALRALLSRALSDPKQKKRFAKHLVPMAQAELFLPVAIGDYSDFFTSLHHATNAGRMFRPDNPLTPNYKWLPIGYHGRASSVVVSGTPVVRPSGQRKPPETPAPSFGPSRRLDYEAEIAFVVGPGNPPGKPIRVRRALDHVFGVVLLNDWSARDLQAWEYQPLGPFLAKSFATTISPWIVTLEALEPFRVPAFVREAGDPAPLAYLHDEADQREGMFAIEIEMHLRSAKMRAAKMRSARLSRGNYATSYWTPAQIVAHHASNGCNLRPGDLLGSGTISGPAPDSVGSLLELTMGGKQPIRLPSGEQRGFLEDGDEVIECGRCAREGFATIGFGEAAGIVKPALVVQSVA
ncbi:MAG: fumarylacetoacetase [Betaproteobacteria bacterium RIFCSPHIGHO2_12_FULL_69_13]|nr:MAG: fumarylacetoacetase [Betaproteobacteria bacterium RIFCSPHIGHO2_12_FULL_69_13]